MGHVVHKDEDTRRVHISHGGPATTPAAEIPEVAVASVVCGCARTTSIFVLFFNRGAYLYNQIYFNVLRCADLVYSSLGTSDTKNGNAIIRQTIFSRKGGELG